MRKDAKVPTKAMRERMKRNFLYGRHADEPMYRAVSANFDTTVAYCEYCGKPLNASEVNDFGSLCERCYMEEYYGK